MTQDEVEEQFVLLTEIGAEILTVLDSSGLNEEGKHKVLTLVKATLEPLGQPITVRWNGKKETPGKVGYV